MDMKNILSFFEDKCCKTFEMKVREINYCPLFCIGILLTGIIESMYIHSSTFSSLHPSPSTPSPSANDIIEPAFHLDIIHTTSLP